MSLTRGMCIQMRKSSLMKRSAFVALCAGICPIAQAQSSVTLLGVLDARARHEMSKQTALDATVAKVTVKSAAAGVMSAAVAGRDSTGDEPGLRHSF
jgi:hypothetical protein